MEGRPVHCEPNKCCQHCMQSAGPSAVLAALVASGIACDTFQFVGFLHAKQGQRQKQLKQLAGGCPSHLAGPCLLAIHSSAPS